MNYALVENGTVSNIIWLNASNAEDFPSAVFVGDCPVQIGDGYTDGVFIRDGLPVRTPLEEARETIATLDALVIDLTYQNILLELGM